MTKIHTNTNQFLPEFTCCCQISLAQTKPTIVSVKDTMISEWFESEFRGILLPSLDELGKPSVITLDNARFHRMKHPQELAKKAQYQYITLLLPPYSPELNSIEQIWVNIKKWLRSYFLMCRSSY